MAKSRLSDAGYDAVLLGGMGLCTSMAMYGWTSGHDWIVLTSGFAGAGLAWNLFRGPVHKRKQKYKRRFAYGTELTPLQFQRVNQETGQATYKTKEMPIREFIYYQDPPFCPVPESTFIQFVKLGRKRELNARYGSQLGSYQWQGKGRRLKTNEAWSAVYFTKRRRDKFIEPVYYSCMKILLLTGFVTPPRPGHPGNLIDPGIGDLEIATSARAWWLYITQPDTTPLPGWWGRTGRRLSYLTN
jgi:hypothetical protein